MKLVSLIFTLSLLSPLAAHAQEANVKKVLNMYDTGTSADRQSIVSILTAVEDGMGWANAELSKRGFNFPAHRNLRVSEGVENLLR
jgi:hypothetical protein